MKPASVNNSAFAQAEIYVTLSPIRRFLGVNLDCGSSRYGLAFGFENDTMNPEAKFFAERQSSVGRVLSSPVQKFVVELMSAPLPRPLGRSADVQMRLFVNGSILSIGQLGIGFMILDDPNDYPPCDAKISLSLDGDERSWTVCLPDGVSAEKPRTRIA